MAGQDHLLAKAFLATGAAAYVYGQCVVLVTGTTLDPNQVVIATTGAGANDQPPPVGLCQENLDLVKVQTGKAYISVALAGIGYAIAGAAVAVGDVLIPSGAVAGRLITATFTSPPRRPQVGIAVGPASAAGDIIPVLLTPGARA